MKENQHHTVSLSTHIWKLLHPEFLFLGSFFVTLHNALIRELTFDTIGRRPPYPNR